MASCSRADFLSAMSNVSDLTRFVSFSTSSCWGDGDEEVIWEVIWERMCRKERMWGERLDGGGGGQARRYAG